MFDEIEGLYSHYSNLPGVTSDGAARLVECHIMRETMTRRQGRPAKKPIDDESLTAQIEAFANEHCHEANGQLIEFAEFRERFNASRPDHTPVSAKRLAMKLPARIVYGAYTDNKRFVANLHWGPTPPTGKPPFTSHNGQLLKGRHSA